MDVWMPLVNDLGCGPIQQVQVLEDDDEAVNNPEFRKS